MNAADLSLSVGMQPPASEPALYSDWEVWDDENTVDLCEVRLTLHGLALSQLRPHPFRRLVG